MIGSRIDIPTALTAGETRLLQGMAAGRIVVEGGSLLGYSTVAMAQVARQVIAVDPHDGYPHFAPRPTLKAFTENIRRHQVAERVRPIVGIVAQAFPKLTADACFLDLTAAFGVTFEAIEHAFQVAPIVAVHDYGRGGCAGATDAVDYFVRTRGLVVHRRDTLVILERRP